MTHHSEDNKSRYVKKWILLLLLLVIMLTIIGGFSAVLKYTLNLITNLPSINDPFTRSLPESTRIYDKDGNVIYTIFDQQNRIYVPISKIPVNMRMAMISAEDINFYHEAGIDPLAIMRAGVHDIFFNTDDTSLQGASTITQQLIKYTSLNQSRSIERKVKEVILALGIARVYSKDTILETYLNTVPFGGNNYGIEAASRAYFDKDVSELDMAQEAFLAGLVQAPGAYSPVFSDNPNALKDAMARQHYVLNQMLIHNKVTHVTNDEVNKALAEKLVFKSNDQVFNDPSFSLYIRDWLYKKYGRAIVQNDGLNVYTNLDPTIQKIAIESIKEGVASNLSKGLNANNASLIAIDAKNGHLISMVGSVNYFDVSTKVRGKVNMTITPYSPGSGIEPFIYLTGFEHGFNPDSILDDSSITFSNGFSPTDFDNSYDGQLTLTKALLGSRNIPAIEVAQKVGMKSIFASLLDAGMSYISHCPIYPTDLRDAGGACDTSLIQETNAFNTLSQDGVRYDILPVSRVTDKFGKGIYSEKVSSKQIFQNNQVVQLNNILKEYPTLQVLKLKGYDVTGFAGTSDFNKNSTFIGYSPKITAGVWTGNTDQSLTSANTFGNNTASPIWNDFMLKVLSISK